jgi:predicted dehydrogenase
MPRIKKISIGIAGCGRIADLQCLGYYNNSNAVISAVCDPDIKRAEHCSRKWKVDKIFTSYNELLYDSGIQAIDILSPHHLHADMAIDALHAGKHVSLQKPPALTIRELDDIELVSRKSRKIIRVFENFLYYPPHIKALELIRKGDIGEPVSIRIKTAVGSDKDGWVIDKKTLDWRQTLSLSGGGPLTFDHGYHCYSMARFFIPAEIKCVHAFINWTRLPGDRWTDGPALISWEYGGKLPRYGCWEVIESKKMRVRSHYYPSDDRIEIHGTEGIIWINRCSGYLLDEPSVVLYREGETRSFHDIETDWAESFRLGGIDFINCLKEEKQPRQNLADARKTLAFALAVAKSAAEHREVRIDEILKKPNS